MLSPKPRNPFTHLLFARLPFAICILALLIIVIAACQSTPPPQQTSESVAGTVTPTHPPATPSRTPQRSTSTPGITHIPTDTPDEIDPYCCADYRIALLKPPTTLNYWAYLGEDLSPWTDYVIGDEAPSLYAVPALRSADRPDFVPALAADLPPEGELRGDLWVIPVRLLDNLRWSDGEPLTAHDIVFTVQTVFDFQLGGRWAEYYPAESLVAVEAPSDDLVEFHFRRQPGLSEWQFAAAMGPIMPRHYWETYVAEARQQIKGMEPPGTCSGTLTEAQQAICQAFAQARQALYAVEPVSPPSGGGYATAGYTSDRTIRRQVNRYFYAEGMKISEYADGTWVRVFADGTMQEFYGQAQGDPQASYHRGPHNRSIEFHIYTSASIAYDALAKGRVDYVLNPNRLTEEWLLLTAQEGQVAQHTSPQNGLVYLAFNLHRYPFDQLEFRQAVEILIDREQIVARDLQGLAYPAMSIVPEPNTFWRNPTLKSGSESPSLDERLDLALNILKEAGWSWRTEPAWDAAARQIIPGDELRLPDGNPIPEISLIYPLPESDLLVAAFGQEVADLLTALGIPVAAEGLARDPLINRTLIVGGSFDLYILDWRLPLYPDYLCQLFYSDYDTLLTGGYNTTGYSNPQFDQLCDAFLAEPDVNLAQVQAHQLQALLAEDLPYIPLFYPQIFDMFRENVVFPYLPEFNGITGVRGFQTDARVLNK